jgi:hypothetical protein
VIYIDEFSMKTNIIANHGYSNIGERFRIVEPKCPKNISGIAAISENGIIGYSFKEGAID